MCFALTECCVAFQKLNGNPLGRELDWNNHKDKLMDLVRASLPVEERLLLIELAIGLKQLDLPVLQVLCIHDAVCAVMMENQFEMALNDAQRWAIAKLVKHFDRD